MNGAEPLYRLDSSDRARSRAPWIAGWLALGLFVVGVSAFGIIRTGIHTVAEVKLPRDYLSDIQRGELTPAYDLLYSDLANRITRTAFTHESEHKKLSPSFHLKFIKVTPVGDQTGQLRFEQFSYALEGSEVASQVSLCWSRSPATHIHVSKD